MTMMPPSKESNNGQSMRTTSSQATSLNYPVYLNSPEFNMLKRELDLALNPHLGLYAFIQT